MKYLVRQKVFSFRDSFTIKNEFGDDCFRVYGRIFSFGKKLTLTDLQDRELYYIEQRLFRFLPEYTIYQNGIPIAHVKNCIECERLQEYEKSIDKQCKSKHRPVEEDVLEKEMRGDYIHDLNGDEPYDGEQALEEVLSFGSSDSPQVGAPLGNRQDAAENDRSIREIEDVDQISNEMYKKQLQ